jgi:hypothetical protein
MERFKMSRFARLSPVSSGLVSKLQLTFARGPLADIRSTGKFR